MFEILVITGPIYLIIMTGFLAVRFALFSQPEMRVLGKLVVNLALPCLLFNAVAQRSLADILDPGYLLAYATGTLLVIATGLFVGRQIKLESASAKVYVAMGMSSSNSAFVGFPILLLTLPAVAPAAFAMNVIIENLLVLPLLLLLADRGEPGQAGDVGQFAATLYRLLRHPLILALFSGLTVAMLELELPLPLTRSIDLFAQASSAISLLVIGGTLHGLSLSGMTRRALPVVLGKLLLHPLLVFLAFKGWANCGLTVSPAIVQAGILLAAMPTMSVYPVLAQRHGQEVPAAASLLLTTLGSFVSVNALLALLHAGYL